MMLVIGVVPSVVWSSNGLLSCKVSSNWLPCFQAWLQKRCGVGPKGCAELQPTKRLSDPNDPFMDLFQAFELSITVFRTVSGLVSFPR